jgi:hypothetical protein
MVPYFKDGLIRRWEQAVKIQFSGLSKEQLAFLKPQIDKINELKLLPKITIVKSGGNVKIYNAKKSQFKKIFNYGNDEYYKNGSWFYYAYWNDKNQMTKILLAISSEIKDQKVWNTKMLSAILSSLGFLGDYDNARDSVSDNKANLQAFGKNDWQLLKMLYNKKVKCGMMGEQALKALAAK